jgi:hypothetical protein
MPPTLEEGRLDNFYIPDAKITAADTAGDHGICKDATNSHATRVFALRSTIQFSNFSAGGG